jgi:hypothetical protein
MARNNVRVGVGVHGAKQAASELDKFRDKFDRLQKQGAKGFAIGAGAAITTKAFDLMGLAASSAADFIGDSIGAASDLNETLSKSRTIFGDSADEIEAWADTAADAFGSSKKDALDAASGFAGLFSTVGLGLDKSAEMGKKLTELGSDLASFFNTDVATALGALKSGLSGESEPLRKFNVFLSETAVSAELARMGIKKVGGQFTEAQKATARYKIILDQTTTAQGDFERTSDGLANTQRSLEAAMADVQAEIGQKLLPVMLDLANFAKDEIVPAIEAISDAADEAAPVLDILGLAAQHLIDPLGSMERAMGFLADREAEAAQEAKDAAVALGEMQRAAFDVEHGLGDTEGALDTTGDATDDLTRDTKELKTAQEKLADALQDTTDNLEELSDEMFGATINAGDLAQAQKDLAEKLKEGPESKKAQDIAIWRGEVAELEQTIFDLQAQMAREAGPKAFYDWLIKQKAAIGDTNAALSIYIDRLIAAAGIRLPGIPHGAEPTGGGGTSPAPIPIRTAPRGALPAFAEGGTVPGPEGSPQVILAHGGEEITPVDGKGGTTINLTVQGSLIAQSKEDVVLALQRAASFVRG